MNLVTLRNKLQSSSKFGECRSILSEKDWDAFYGGTALFNGVVKGKDVVTWFTVALIKIYSIK